MPTWLLTLLGLEDTATEDEARQALEAVLARIREPQDEAGQDQVVACKEVLNALGLDPQASRLATVSAIKALRVEPDRLEELSARLDRTRAELVALKSDRLVEEALAQGKISPAELDAWGRTLAGAEPEQFERIVLSRPRGSSVPVDQALGLNPGSAGLGQTGLGQDQAQQTINRLLGVSGQTWADFGPRER